MGILVADFQEEQRVAITRLGVALLAAFIFPLYAWGYGSGKLMFINIEMLGKSDFITILGLLYPLAAGIIILWAGFNIETVWRPVILLAAGFFPILLGLFNEKDFVAGSLGEYNSNVALMYFIILALLGVFVGSKVTSMTDHIAGRLIGGISGLAFMVMVLLPVGKSSKPVYFELFSLFRAGTRTNLPGSVFFLGIVLIVIFTCYLFASLTGVLNFSSRPSSDRTAANAYRLVFYATAALPVTIILVVLFSGAPGGVKGMIFTLLVKITLLLGGIVGTIATGLWDLIDRLLPRTIKGSTLVKVK